MTCTGVHKSVVALIRDNNVLAFRHPLAGVQLPKGTLQPGETPDVAARREVFEEVGVAVSAPLRAVGTWICPEPASIWHGFVADAPRDLPASWCHAPTGGGEESGLVFEVIWVRMSDARHVFHPLFHPVLKLMTAHLDQDPKARASQS
ncbi:MAG: NUDIX domain-containing protein [Tateyamaria sp.]